MAFLAELIGTATSIVDLVQAVSSDGSLTFATGFDYICYPISLALTIVLTLMIVTRLVLHDRKMRDASGSGVNAGGLYKSIITTLVESYALYTVSFILSISLEYGGSSVEFIFDTIFSATQVSATPSRSWDTVLDRCGKQVIAPFLIILRAAKPRALTSGSINSAGIGSIHFKSQGQSTGDNWTSPDKDPVNSTEADGSTPGDKGPGAKSTIEEVPL